MNYELALELRKAGFPQEGKGEWVVWKGVTPSGNKPTMYVPTLSELIEACGKGWMILHRDKDGEWDASNSRKEVSNCSTPEEAVVKLWLALNPTNLKK